MMDAIIDTEYLQQIWHIYRAYIIFAYLSVYFFIYLRSTSPPPEAPIDEEKPSVLEFEVKTNGVVVLPAEIKDDFKIKKRAPPKRITGGVRKKTAKEKKDEEEDNEIQIYVFYSTLTGSTERQATKFAAELFAEPTYTPSPAPPQLKSTPPLTPTTKPATILPPIVHNVDYLDLDDWFITPPKSTAKAVYLILVPSYEITSPLDAFISHLFETHHDFRIDSKPLRSLAGFSVFGFGDREGWPQEAGMGSGVFCGQAKEVDRWMSKLTGGKRLFPLGFGNKPTAEENLKEWRLHLEVVLKELAENGGESVPANDGVMDSEDEEDVAQEETIEAKLVDVEDIGKSIRKDDTVAVGGGKRKVPIPVDFTSAKEMVGKGSPTYEALTKQGYTIVGSHSGVKLCRWTKSALRGRGSCYKFSFYGIKSHLCMETTPSLSCSNKCVFCWRHGTNPVSTTWNWTVDPPDFLLAGVMDGHYRKIKQMKGVPGIRADRFAEAFTIQHCALSLVGEPIFYPHINEFLRLLHARRISSFLVCNAQHPDQLAALGYVTQLYVSIDASNRESLKKIDRPLHRDFWERFQRCLEILRAKRGRMRTVFRLTLVKGFNVEDEVEGYADLVEKGLPGFVEVKGVTYCGTSTSVGAGLTMQNVPFYEEVAEFVVKLNETLEKRGLAYGIAAEHAHSCCILIASRDYYIDEKWHTLIDYAKFFQLLESGEDFSPLDYIGEPTPGWATWGNGGFDPADQRVYRKGKNKGMIVGPTIGQAGAAEVAEAIEVI